MNFLEAKELINKGKKVRRKSWKFKDFYIPNKLNEEEDQPSLSLKDIDADDWEVFTGKKFCKECGAEL